MSKNENDKNHVVEDKSVYTPRLELLKDRNAILFIAAISIGIISGVWYIAQGSAVENQQREQIQSDLEILKTKINSPQNVTVINNPGNVTVVVPNASSQIEDSEGKISSVGPGPVVIH